MRFAKIFAAAAVVTATFGVGPRANAQEDAKLRVAHFSPNAPAVDVYLDGAKKFAQVPFPLMSAYTPIPAGKHTIEMRTAGAAATDKPLVSLTTTLAAGKPYLIAAVGDAATVSAKEFNDDLTPPAAGKSRLRIINAVVGGPAVDAVADGSAMLATNLPSNGASSYQEIDAKKYDLSIRAANKPDVLVSKTITLQSGGAYTIVAIGDSAKINLRGFADVASTGAAAGGVADPTGADGSKVPTSATAGDATSTPSASVTAPAVTAPVVTAPVVTAAPVTAAPLTAAPTTKIRITTPPTTAAAPASSVPIGGVNAGGTNAGGTKAGGTNAGGGADTAAGGTTVDVAAGAQGSANSTPASGVATGFGGMSDANSALVVVAMTGLAGAFVLMGLRRRQSVR